MYAVAYPAPAREYIPTASPQSYPQAAPPQPVVAQYDEGHNNNYRVPYAAAPPPAGYPINNTNCGPETSYALPVQTNSKGEGFWKGW